MSGSISVLVLTRNEAGNIVALLDRARAELQAAGFDADIVVVDANSDDGTADLARSCGARVVEQTQPGYANALRQGFGLCSHELVLTLDGDLSHKPEFIGDLLRAIESSDLAIASRYVEGGRADMPWSRQVLSRLLNYSFGTVLGVAIRDMSSGYRLYRREVITAIETSGEHFDVLPEIVAEALRAGFRVVEVPFHYHPREAGISKARVLHFAPSYIRTLVRCARRRRRPGRA